MFRILIMRVSLPLLAWLGICVWGVNAQETRPTLQRIRYLEDWGVLRDPKLHIDVFDPLKFIPLNRDGTRYLTLGADIRERYEFFRNEQWGGEKLGNENSSLQRYMFHADLRWNRRLRFFTQLRSVLQFGRDFGPRPVDADRFDVHQAFTEVSLHPKHKLNLRVGRQEIELGSSRLVSIREGPNARLSFDGGRLQWQQTKWKFDVFAVRPAKTVIGVFDNTPDHRQSFWGAQAAGVLPFAASGLDVYYLGLDRKDRRFDQGRGREQRHSVGARFYRKPKGLDFDYEALYQFGDFGSDAIRAWTVASNTGYTWDEVRLRPRIGLKADIASGDRNPTDRELNTFNALFPKGAYFSQADVLGPYNLMDVHPSLTLELRRGVSLTTDGNFFWRQSTSDGVYDVPGNLIVSGRGSDARFIGQSINCAFDWKINRHVSFEAEYQHLFAGRFIRDKGLGRTIIYFGAWMTFRF